MGGRDDDNLERGLGDKEICIVFDVDSNHQQCKSRETVMNLFMQAVFADDGG